MLEALLFFRNIQTPMASPARKVSPPTTPPAIGPALDLFFGGSELGFGTGDIEDSPGL